MEARAKAFGHPIHQMLIVFPLGLLATSFFFDLGARFMGARPHAISRMRLVGIAVVAGVALVGGLPATWPIVIGFGLVCAVLAAIVLLGAAAGTH